MLDDVERDDLRIELVENAYRDLVGSNHFSYGAFVDEIERTSLARVADHDDDQIDSVWRITQGLDRWSWRDVALRVRALELGSRVLGPAARRARHARRLSRM